MLNNFGMDVVDELFPVFPSFYDPIIPKGTPFNFTPIPLDAPDSLYIADADREKIPYQPDERNGSNKWAVAGSRTKSGAPILANDPHLGLTLPSIWYAMHLVSPSQNTMGVTIPGAPGIISGFNPYIAWGETNGNDDVMDWYDITFKDESKSEYLFDGEWIQTTSMIEEIKVRDEETIYDTVIYTHHGPVVWEEIDQTLAMGKYSLKNNVCQTSIGRALRWLAHTPANEMRTFYELNRAKDYNDFTKALRHFTCPGQNFVYADIKGNIAIWHTGNNPAKWEKQGMFISDGTNSKYDWQATIPHEQKPHIKNPDRGFVSSANQHPTDENYPYFLAEFFWPSFRGHRINERLSEMQSGNIFEVLSVQMDNTNIMARRVTPHLIESLSNFELNDAETNVLKHITTWDYSFDHSSIGATIFQQWFDALEVLVWKDNFGLDDEQYIWPYSNKLAELIQFEPNSKWFDIDTTDAIESFSDLSQLAFTQAVQELTNKFGEIDDSWQWQYARGTDIRHLAKIPGFGDIGVPTAGGSLVPNATGKYFGPSWRYAVEMTETPKAYGIYPGGQSGYPGSKYYDNMVDDWSIGKSYPLIFSNSASDIQGHISRFGGNK
jgi:penicillin amidase